MARMTENVELVEKGKVKESKARSADLKAMPWK